MEGWLLSNQAASELTEKDHGVHRLVEAAAQKNIKLTVYAPNELDLLVTDADDKTVVVNDSRVTLPDFILPRVGANVSYFGLAMIRQLEQLGVYVCNGSESISMSKDKLRMVQMLNHNHLPTPKTMLVKFPMSMDRVRTEIGFPLVLKMVSGAKGVGVHLCETPHALEEIMEIISAQIHHSPMIVQEFIQSSYGRDLRVFVLGGRVVACMQRSSGRGFKANYSLGGSVKSYPMTPEIEHLACESAALFGLEIAGIDLLFDGDGFKVCEANSAPGFKGIELASNIDIASQVLEHIRQLVLRS
ncbi:MAG: RimK family alpha-L-glutamate ligase [Legionellaceae bacterium]|nr:RimK family alpha-L-glutamate ligase [Legionellaceae bacterium]